MQDDKTISRREFLKRFGLGAAVTTAALTGCAPKNRQTTAKAAVEPDASKMTYRTTPTTGDRVSLLGYGCMRWPLIDPKDRTSHKPPVIDVDSELEKFVTSVAFLFFFKKRRCDQFNILQTVYYSQTFFKKMKSS